MGAEEDEVSSGRRKRRRSHDAVLADAASHPAKTRVSGSEELEVLWSLRMPLSAEGSLELPFSLDKAAEQAMSHESCWSSRGSGLVKFATPSTVAKKANHSQK